MCSSRYLLRELRHGCEDPKAVVLISPNLTEFRLRNPETIGEVGGSLIIGGFEPKEQRAKLELEIIVDVPQASNTSS